ncbi:tRNA (adenosine(37)-N6)-dimethylallyltransferase MiaA [bacterium]|nr:tRNA (adenosine(37)-N6)-dimethylallyltransferase MiaA [bacterium]
MKIIFLLGPTGIGKTDLAFSFAKKYNCQIISCDSIQIYQFLNLGTGKPTKEEMKGIKQYLYDHIHPNSYYSAFNFYLDVKQIIEDHPKENFIISGGTGLFVEALIRGIAPSIPRDENLRNELREQANKSSWKELYDMLYELDENYAKKISKNDHIRIIRALEIYFLTGKTMNSLKEETRRSVFINKYTLLNLICERKDLYERIDIRVDSWFNEGWIEEVKELYNGKIIKNDFKAIGFKEIMDFLNGKIKSKSKLIELVKQKERNYAKRQITWFKRYDERIDIERNFNEEKDLEKIENILIKKGVLND